MTFHFLSLLLPSNCLDPPDWTAVFQPHLQHWSHPSSTAFSFSSWFDFFPPSPLNSVCMPGLSHFLYWPLATLYTNKSISRTCSGIIACKVLFPITSGAIRLTWSLKNIDNKNTKGGKNENRNKVGANTEMSTNYFQPTNCFIKQSVWAPLKHRATRHTQKCFSTLWNQHVSKNSQLCMQVHLSQRYLVFKQTKKMAVASLHRTDYLISEAPRTGWS